MYEIISVRFLNNAGKSGSASIKYTPTPHGKLLRGNFIQRKVHPPSNFLQTVQSSSIIPIHVKLLADNLARKVLLCILSFE